MTTAAKPRSEPVAPSVVAVNIDQPDTEAESEKYEVLQPFKHAGKMYEPGSTVSLSSEMGQHMAGLRFVQRKA